MSQQLIQDELRAVVLGPIQSGKTSMINAFLGQKGSDLGKRTVKCVKSKEEVEGRKLILIDTPGWWRNVSLIETAEFIKHKIVLSVSNCQPGPHAFILVIDIDTPFTEKNRRSVKEHVGLFGEKVWEHTIVVFTRGESLDGESIEKDIESEGEALKWLIEKCGNRCFMFYIKSTKGCNEANKLLEQIDVLAKTRNSYFELDEKILREVEEKRNTYRERAQQRWKKVMDQREILQKCDDIHSTPEFKIILLGWLFSGKTSAMNTILGQLKDAKRSRTYQSERQSGEVAGRRVSVVDTPGWWKYVPAEYTPEWLKMELQRGLTLDSKAPHAILLAVPVDTTFLEEQRKITEENMKMFGEQIWRHTIVLFTCGDLLGDTSIEEHIEGEGEPLRWLVEKCGNRYHVQSWYDEEKEVMELLKKIEEMIAGLCLFKPELIDCIDKKSTENMMEVSSEMVQFLDQKWQKMDRELEEKIVTICGSTSKLKGSMDGPDTNFGDAHPSSQDEELKSGKLTSPPNAKSPIKKSAFDAATGLEDQETTSEKPAGHMERLKEMLEREWRRRELGVTQRFQRQLSELRESGSAADVQDLNLSYRKVVWWMHHGTSGHGSDIPEDDSHT